MVRALSELITMEENYSRVIPTKNERGQDHQVIFIPFFPLSFPPTFSLSAFHSLFFTHIFLLLSLFSIQIILLKKIQLLSLVTLTSWTITSCTTVSGMAVREDPIHQETYVALGILGHPPGVGSGNVGRSHGVNPINMDLIGHYDVALSQQGIDPMNVGPNYRLGSILKTEGGPFGPVGGPLNPHIGPYYGLHGHRFHSSRQADSLLSGQSGPLEPSLIPSPVQHPILTNQYTNPEALGHNTPCPHEPVHKSRSIWTHTVLTVSEKGTSLPGPEVVLLTMDSPFP